MARKVETLVIDAAGRDKGKHFVITEMSAVAAEKWAWRALSAVARAGVEIPEDIAGAGMAGIAAIGIRAITTLAFADAEPLLDEMMACAVFMPSPAKPAVTRAIREDDIEEPVTVLRIRDEVVKLHLGFSVAANLLALGAAAKERANSKVTAT